MRVDIYPRKQPKHLIVAGISDKVIVVYIKERQTVSLNELTMLLHKNLRCHICGGEILIKLWIVPPVEHSLRGFINERIPVYVSERKSRFVYCKWNCLKLNCLLYPKPGHYWHYNLAIPDHLHDWQLV